MITYIKESFLFDRVRFIMYFTWVWAWVNLKVINALGFFYSLLLHAPNRLLNLYDGAFIKTTQGKEIKIIAAFNEKAENITGKFKLFLSNFWELAGDAHYTNGFDFRKFKKLTGENLLYFIYTLMDNGNITEFQRRLVSSRETVRGNVYDCNTDEDFSIFLNHVNFDDEKIPEEEIDLSGCLDEN